MALIMHRLSSLTSHLRCSRISSWKTEARAAHQPIVKDMSNSVVLQISYIRIIEATATIMEIIIVVVMGHSRGPF